MQALTRVPENLDTKHVTKSTDPTSRNSYEDCTLNPIDRSRETSLQ